MPQAVVVAVASGDIVPGVVGVRRHAVGGALLLNISLSDRAAQCVLHAKQNYKNTSVHSGQTRINRNTQHNGIKNKTKKQL